jgi:radical SAM-linked protein
VSDVPETREARQRWRLVVAREADAAAASQREIADAWTSTIETAGLPLARTEGDRPRPRVSFGAPLPVGMAAEGELIDVVLVERWPAWRVREALADRLPTGWRIIELVDVWLAGPPLAGRVAAADYRIEIAGPADVTTLARAATELLDAERLPRERAKGDATVTYDLRPLLIALEIEGGTPVIVRTRTRFHPELGTGRPEEVLAALGDRTGGSLEAASIVRERLLLVDDLDDGDQATSVSRGGSPSRRASG